MIVVTDLHYPLDVLRRAIEYKNLTAAAEHIGLSQPQLSRLVKRIEEELQVIILDRSAKRKSGWTPIAYKLVDTYSQSQRRLETALTLLREGDTTKELHIGCLEGLVDSAFHTCKYFYEHSKIELVSLDIYDLNELEQKFTNADLDIIFTSRLPGKKKYDLVAEFGYQTLDMLLTNDQYRVLSPFQYGRLHRTEKQVKQKTLVSNSLFVRRQWLESIGGFGNLPSPVHKQKQEKMSAVYIVGGDTFHRHLWQLALDSLT